MEVNVKNILIVTGGSVDYMWAEEWLKKHIFDYVIAADSGLVHCDRLNINVDFLLGDYDSVDKDVFEKYSKNTTTKTYPPEKNYTDTHLALIKAIEKRPDSISIIGATGTRYDHALTNIGILKCAVDEDIQCAIYDANNKIYLADKDLKIVVDATKDLLVNVLQYHPFLIKPNNHELGEIFGVKITEKEDVITYAKKMQEKGAGNVLVSMAGDGAVLVAEDGSIFQAEAPKGKVVNSVGAGDSMVAGFVTGYLKTGSYKEAFQMGVCTGSASAFSEELATEPEVLALLDKNKGIFK